MTARAFPGTPPPTIPELCSHVGIEATYKGREKSEGWEHDAWTVDLTYQGRTYPGISYRMGTGHSKPYPPEYEPLKRSMWKPTPPDASTVIDSLLRDIEGIDQPFESWASDLGMDQDSRTAEATYRACLETLPRLRALLGVDFERFEQAERL